MSDFVWILSKNEDFVIIFGGQNHTQRRIRNIFIWDINAMKFHLSKVEMSYNELFSAVLMTNEKDMILLFGFVRNAANEYDMNIPSAIVKLLHNYVETETIYLCQSHRKSGLILKIELSDILDGKIWDVTTGIDYFTDSESDSCSD